jgi:peptidyl-prolyl cis-trans isomerase D
MALQSLRKHSKGWVAGILFFLLILAFAAWGIEDMLRQGLQRTGPALTVGSEQVSQREFQAAYNRMIRNLNERFQRQFDYETAKSLGLVNALVAELQAERMFAQEARSLGLLVSDRLAHDQIRNDENFRGGDGRFDPNAFRNALDRAGFTEPNYVSLVKGTLARNFLVTGISQFEGTPPKSLADRIFAYRSEFRTAEVLTVPTESVKPSAPTDEQLAEFHKANGAKYTAPEYRTLMLVWLRPADAAARVPVTDKDIEAEYARRQDEFTTPETRALRQLIIKDEATAKAAHEALMGGRNFETVAKDIAKVEPASMGKLTAAQIPSAEMREAVLKLKPGEVTAPLKSPFGWHIVILDEIAPAATKPLAEVKEQVEKDYRDRQAIKVIAELRDKFEDALGGGAKLEAAAEKLDLKVLKLGPLDAQGKDEKGAAVEDIPDDGEFVRRAFRSAKGEEGELFDLRAKGFYSFRIDEIRPSAVRPLETIKEQVTADWTAAERAKLAKAEAEKLLAESKAGKPLEEVAKAGNYTVRKSKPVNRGESGGAAPGSIEERIFAVKPGEAALAQVREGWAVLKVEEAKDERSEADRKKAREDFEKNLRETYEQDFLAGYSNYLRARYSTKVEQETIDQLLGGTRRQ